MNICEFPIEIINQNKHKTSIKEASTEAYWKLHEGEEKYNNLVSNYLAQMGKNFKAYCTLELISGYSKVGSTESHCFILIDKKDDRVNKIKARVVFVTEKNLTNALEDCQKEIKNVLKQEGLKVNVLSEEVTLFLVENNDKANTKVEIKAAYKKREAFDQNDIINISILTFFIVLCIVFRGFSNSQEIQSFSMSVGATFFASLLLIIALKFFGKKKIRIDDFQQWMKEPTEKEKIFEELAATDPVNRPKT